MTDYERSYRRLLIVVSVLLIALMADAVLGAGVLIWAVSTNPQWGWLDKTAVVLMALVMGSLAAAIGWFSHVVWRL